MSVEENTTGIRMDDVLRVLDMTRLLAANFDLDRLLEQVLQTGMQLLDAEMGALWLYEPDTRELVSALPVLEPPLRVPEGLGLCGLCAAERRIINVLDAALDPRFRGSIDNAVGFTTRSMLNVPLIARDGALIGVLQFLDEQLAGYDDKSETLATILAAQCALALQHVRLADRVERSERLEREVEVAREIQRSTLPTQMPELAGYEAHGHFLPASYAGGDLFDLVVLDDRLFVLLGDATGHGFGPALSATQMQAMMRVAFRCGAGLGEAYRHVNNQLAEDLPADRFITAFMGFLDPGSHELHYLSAGQGPILHYHAGEQRAEWHQPTTFPVGILDIDEVGPTDLLALSPGDIVALISDGLYEYANSEGQLFGEARVADILARCQNLPMSELCEVLLEEAQAFGNGAAQADDITLVLLKRLVQ
ncbi:PP2C family protein-serine/threonine phosphatase [Haliea sp. E17]|uniref:PP2C family protein-serine/threonine phosphatase n=1 Tax=Haliea sp. E17 TaxID=3401576 RepID=UPI003AAAE0BE